MKSVNTDLGRLTNSSRCSEPNPTSLRLLARRQAEALALGRRRQLSRLASRLGLEMTSPPYDPVPRRLCRPYELIGWRPPAPSAE